MGWGFFGGGGLCIIICKRIAVKDIKIFLMHAVIILRVKLKYSFSFFPAVLGRKVDEISKQMEIQKREQERNFRLVYN